jgi:hypothetical protein
VKSKFYINGVLLEESFEEKDLGIIINPELNWDKQIIKVCSQATQLSKQLSRCFKYKSVDVIKKLYTSLIRPKLEYANTIWSPLSKKHSKMLESVQKRWTRTGVLARLNYTERLRELGLTTLATRRLRGDLIQIFKIMKGFDSIHLLRNPLSHNTRTRGHCYKLSVEFCKHDARSYFLLNRVHHVWNSLPDTIIMATSINEFKNKLDDINLDQYLT